MVTQTGNLSNLRARKETSTISLPTMLSPSYPKALRPRRHPQSRHPIPHHNHSLLIAQQGPFKHLIPSLWEEVVKMAKPASTAFPTHVLSTVPWTLPKGKNFPCKEFIDGLSTTPTSLTKTPTKERTSRTKAGKTAFGIISP